MNKEALVVFGREPVPGRVKTRLAKQIGAKQASEIYLQLLQKTMDVALRVDTDRYLYLPSGDRWECPTGFLMGVQQGHDLGSRMDNAFRECFASGHERVVLIGSDCPYLTDRHIAAAFDALREVDTVFGPAQDGGYYLVGQNSPGRDLFSDIPWSTSSVWEATVELLRRAGWSWLALETLEDIDDRDSLCRYQATSQNS